MDAGDPGLKDRLREDTEFYTDENTPTILKWSARALLAAIR
ncbi:hypothetical protein OIU34_17545 [Pararhizobium sp. BT-229]|nr:hypothetical protein [Pararhizobium sp. BT-229]MCV9963702.1 hypothetical protein [Pararhizobium sp. BT-229]